MSSEVWQYFERFGKDKAKCTKCPKILSCVGSSTSSLHNHARCVHKIITTPKVKQGTADETASGSATAKNSLLKYATKNETLGEIFARCVAEDGMSVRAVKRSRVVLSYLHSKNFSMPSETTIWEKIDQFYQVKQEELKNKFLEIKKNHGRFSIIVDEWTDLSYLKYVNVTVKCFNPETKTLEIYNLGLKEINIKANAFNLEQVIKAKLGEYSLNFERDIVASTHDGASVMKKYGNNIAVESQLCINHGIHLCVVKTIYSEKDYAISNPILNESEDEYEQEETEDHFENLFILNDENVSLTAI
ncbi:uncharacterized protein LOC124418588 [Lucilia cuprina]|uniref:uncharacterized protein LOC124418588 n=1 Tax=Lucilia cuprina TaxID=7375 RepID=UPI001F05B662|nr:uncharacterized protein LOC124418588 [Lucilia cuprina]